MWLRVKYVLTDLVHKSLLNDCETQFVLELFYGESNSSPTVCNMMLRTAFSYFRQHEKLLSGYLLPYLYKHNFNQVAFICQKHNYVFKRYN